jgi:O-antigen/teichoic acid export membrane protein
VKFLNDYKHFVHRIGLAGITNILVALSTLIMLPIVTKNFGADGYGIWVQISINMALISIFANLGLSYALLRFLSMEEDREKIQEGFYSIAFTVFIVSLSAALLLFLFSNSIGTILFGGNIAVAKIMAFLTFFASINLVLMDYFRTFQQMKKYSLFLVIQTYLGVFLVFYLAFSGQNITIAVLGLLISYVIVFLGMFLFIFLEIGFKMPKFKNMKKYLFFGLPTIPGGLSFWIVESSDRYLIAILLSTVFVGYYSPGYTLGNVILMFLAPILLILPSILPKYYDSNEMEVVRTFLEYSLKYFLLAAIPTVFALSLLSKPLLTILTTPEIALNSYLVTPFVALSALIAGIYGIIANVIVLKKKTKVIGIIWILAAVLNFSLNIILIPIFGILSAAAVTLASYSFSLVCTVLYLNKYFQFEFDLRFIWKSAVASTLMSLIIIIINPTEVINLLITIMACFVIYSSAILILKALKKEEIEFLKGIFRIS